jgi:hypothetical protein
MACRKDRPPDTEGVDDMARRLLKAVGEGNVETAYEMFFSKEFHQNTSLQEWKKQADLYRKRLGAFISMERILTRVTVIAGFGEGQVCYEVKWVEAEGELVLNITENDGWKITSFEIRSPAIQELDEKASTLPTASSKPKK